MPAHIRNSEILQVVFIDLFSDRRILAAGAVRERTLRHWFFAGFFLFFLLVFLFFPLGVSELGAQDEGLHRFQAIRSDPHLQKQLTEIVAVAVLRAYGKSAELPPQLDPIFQRPLGVFVTAKRGDEVRGCMGSLQPRQASLAEEIVKNLGLAFSRDPRHRPIRSEELPEMKIYLSVAGNPQPITRWDGVSPGRDGILLKSGAKEAVILPGEAKTLRYLLAFAKAKAGLRKGEAFQIYRLSSETIAVPIAPRALVAPASR